MGFLQSCVLQLASVDGVVPHVGLSTVRVESMGPSFDERVVSRPQCGAGLRVAATVDRRNVAESVGGCVVRSSPVACGIGGVGVGAERRVEHLLWSSDAYFLRPLRAKAVES